MQGAPISLHCVESGLEEGRTRGCCRNPGESQWWPELQQGLEDTGGTEWCLASMLDSRGYQRNSWTLAKVVKTDLIQ